MITIAFNFNGFLTMKAIIQSRNFEVPRLHFQCSVLTFMTNCCCCNGNILTCNHFSGTVHWECNVSAGKPFMKPARRVKAGDEGRGFYSGLYEEVWFTYAVTYGFLILNVYAARNTIGDNIQILKAQYLVQTRLFCIFLMPLALTRFNCEYGEME